MRRFWSKVTVLGKDECWEWNGCRLQSGYGQFKMEGKPRRAHRVALKLSGVSVPEGSCVMHKCDNPGCVNPNHLRVGSQRENLADMASKGRASRPTGRGNPNAKLSEAQVAKVRALGKLWTQDAIARHIGCGTSTVSRILRGQN